jgi:hypothetical protein
LPNNLETASLLPVNPYQDRQGLLSNVGLAAL